MKKIFLILFLLFFSFELSFALSWEVLEELVSPKVDNLDSNDNTTNSLEKVQTDNSETQEEPSEETPKINDVKTANTTSAASTLDYIDWYNTKSEATLQKIDKNNSSFNNDLFSWIASYNYNFEFPSWIRWLTPSLWISYNSAKVDYLNDSWYWFNINTESIFRATRKWNDKLYSVDEFAINSSFSNNEIQKDSNWNFIWTLNNDLNKYVFENDSWKVSDNNWNIYYFGISDDSRQVNPESSKTFRWILSKKQDNFWNEIRYIYNKVDNNIYLSEIQYGIKDNVPLYKLNLEYLQKNFSAISYLYWFKLENHKLLQNVIISFNNAWNYEEIKRYELNYEEVESIFPKLKKITEKSWSQINENTTFSYFDSWIWINLLSKIDNWRWLTTSLEYKSSALYKNTTVPFILKTLYKVDYSDSITGLKYSKTYDYYGWNFYFDPTNVYNRGYTWFSKVKIIDDDWSYKFVYFHQSDTDVNNPNDILNWEFEDHISKKWKVYREEEYDQNNLLYTTKITKWIKKPRTNNFYFVAPERITNILWNNSWNHIDTAETFEYDNYLNVIKNTKYGEVKANTNNWDFEDIKEDKKVVNYNYAVDSNSLIINKVCLDETFNYSWLSISKTKYVYDNLWDCLVQKWLLTQKWIYYKESSKYINQNFSYENWLLKIKSDFLWNTTKYTYDNYGLLLASETNPLLWTSNYNSYDYKIQKPLEFADYNWIKTKYKYDNFWNITQKSIIKPDDNSEVILEKYNYDFQEIPNYIERIKYLDTNNYILSRLYFDWFWRQIELKVSSKYHNTYSTTKIKYDKDWKQKFVTYPIFENIINYTGIWDNEKGNKFTFDSIWRLITQTNKTWVIKFEYDLLKTTQTNQKLVKKDIINDVFGNLVKVIEYNEWQTYETNYVYNDLNKLSKITDSKQNIRNFYYDSLGRQKKAEDLHPVNNSKFLSINYDKYNDNSFLTQKLTMSWDTIKYIYDNLSRLKRENIWNYNWYITYYDSVPNRWYISSVKNDVYREDYKYNYLWQKIQTQFFYPSQRYLLKYEYNLVGNIIKVIYPDKKVTEYIYKNWYLDSIKYDWNTIVSTIDYAWNNSPTKYTYANWLIDETILDYEYWYRISSKKTYSPKKVYQDIIYVFDEVWNIKNINNSANTILNKKTEYIYDDLSRLTTFNVTSKWWTTKSYNYSYDSIWNILTNSLLWKYLYSSDNGNPHAMSKIWKSITFYYDKNGNISKETNKLLDKSYQYNAKSELLNSSFSWGKINYIYDFYWNRSSKIFTSTGLAKENRYFEDVYEIESSQKLSSSWNVISNIVLPKKYVFDSNKKLFTIESWALVYNFSDHLWWASIDLSSTWALLQISDYLPYGWKRVLNRVSDYKNNYLFTWKELDDETNLQYFEARYYNPDFWRFYWQDRLFWELWQSKRWISVLQDPKQLNSYSYARNNPVIYVDPSGEVAETFWDIWNIVYDVWRWIKNVWEIIWWAISYWVWSVKWDEYLKEASTKWLKSDLKDLWEVWVDAWTDALATMIPFVPAGGSKVARELEEKIRQTEKSIKKYERRIIEHEQKIKDLENWIYYIDPSKIKWDFDKYKEWLIKHWKTDIEILKWNMEKELKILNSLK